MSHETLLALIVSLVVVIICATYVSAQPMAPVLECRSGCPTQDCYSAAICGMGCVCISNPDHVGGRCYPTQ